MANANITYEHYLNKGLIHDLDLLMKKEELEGLTTDVPVLWQCRITGVIFDRAYHLIPNPDKDGTVDRRKSSPGQRYWNDFSERYYKFAEEHGIEFVYDPMTDFAPSNMRSPVKWRGRDGRIVVCDLHQLYHRKSIRRDIREALGIELEKEYA